MTQEELLNQYYQPVVNLLDKIQEFDWIPSGPPDKGNWGNSMIKGGTEYLFSKLRSTYHLMEKPRKGDVLVYGGGGGWCRYFSHGRRICVEASELYKKVIVLPSTYDDGFGYIPSNVTFIARDDVSRRLSNSPLPTIPDMSFLLPKQQDVKVTNDHLNAWRTDKDKHPDRPTPPANNLDITSTGTHNSEVEPLLRLIGTYRKVETDRMHVGIAAAIQEVKKLILHPNGYHKVEATYESFPELYPKHTSLIPFE